MTRVKGFGQGEWNVGDWDKVFWEGGYLPFHETKAQSFLQKTYNQTFPNDSPCRVFVPLCGKTVDIIWLADKGHEVVGLEYSEIAVTSFFKENNLSYEKCDVGVWELYKAKEKNIQIYRGDFYAGDMKSLGIFDVIWDRGGLGSINPSQRAEYMIRIRCLMNKSTKFYADFFLYDGSQFQGPPCSITDSIVKELCGKLFSCEIVFELEDLKHPYMAANGVPGFKTRLFRFICL